MADNNKAGFGFLFGMIVGAIGGVFLAPKSGKESREDVKKKYVEVKGMIESGEMKEKIEKIFGDLSDESVRMYKNVRTEILNKMETMKNMTVEDYVAIVQEAMDKVKAGVKVGTHVAKKMKDEFVKDYAEMKDEVQKNKNVKKVEGKLLADTKK